MLHRCGRNAQDFWPPSEACPQCIGARGGAAGAGSPAPACDLSLPACVACVTQPSAAASPH